MATPSQKRGDGILDDQNKCCDGKLHVAPSHMTDKQPSKAAQVAALRLARADRRPNPFEDAARGRDAPSDTNSGAPKPRGESAQTNAAQPADSPNIKCGRPRIGETRDKPWLRMKPPMSERTWYRRQAEKRESSK